MIEALEAPISPYMFSSFLFFGIAFNATSRVTSTAWVAATRVVVDDLEETEGER